MKKLYKETVRISGNKYDKEFVKNKLTSFTSEHIEYVLDCLESNSTKIRNIRQYLLASLFNAPSTIDNYYGAEVTPCRYSRSFECEYYKNIHNGDG